MSATDGVAQQMLIAPQAFKGSLDAVEVAAAIAAGVHAGWPWQPLPTLHQLPLADGGEGTLQALVANGHGALLLRVVSGPLPDQMLTAKIGWLDDGFPTAVVEIAQAAGLPLVPPGQRNPLHATTRGVGEMIVAALDAGARRVLVALGGSATNDGGAGMAQALGARLLDAAGNDLPPGGGPLANLVHIDYALLDPRLRQVEIIGLTDVANPLWGPEGASAIYGPQKGATPDQVMQLDAALAHYGAVLARDVGQDVAALPGAGAAGGLGAGLLAFGGPRARLTPGADFVLDTVGFAARLQQADFVITGEGRIDGQIAYGKLTGRVAQRARQAGVPALCVVGGLADGYEKAYDLGVSAIIVASEGPQSLADAMADAPRLISGAVARALRLWSVHP